MTLIRLKGVANDEAGDEDDRLKSGTETQKQRPATIGA